MKEIKTKKLGPFSLKLQKQYKPIKCGQLRIATKTLYTAQKN